MVESEVFRSDTLMAVGDKVGQQSSPGPRREIKLVREQSVKGWKSCIDGESLRKPKSEMHE